MDSEKDSRLTVISIHQVASRRNEVGIIDTVLSSARGPVNSQMLVGLEIIPPKGQGGFPMHYHRCEEALFILSGSGIVKDSLGKEYSISEGSFIYCPPGPGGAHQFINNGDAPMRLLYAFPSSKLEDIEKFYVGNASCLPEFHRIER
jgi:mannose-6-phosphate isomerase-like protein (cupin superfamily)